MNQSKCLLRFLGGGVLCLCLLPGYRIPPVHGAAVNSAGIGASESVSESEVKASGNPAGSAEAEPSGSAQPRETAGSLPEFEASAHGFPAMRDSDGRKLADGDFSQWLDKGLLHVKTTYQFSPSHRIEEKVVLRQKPQLVQEKWSWREVDNGTVCRRFEVDFATGLATAEKSGTNGTRHWSQHVKIEPGRTFAGSAFTLALTSARERLLNGEKVELQAVAFTPKPRLATVEISYGGRDRIPMSGRILEGDRFMIHAKVPFIAKLFVHVPQDTKIWLIYPPPVGFLRWEGPLMEPRDPVIRVDLLPGDPSEPAEPE